MINENEMKNINIGDWISYIYGVIRYCLERLLESLKWNNSFGIEPELMVITNVHKVTRSEILEVRKA